MRLLYCAICLLFVHFSLNAARKVFNVNDYNDATGFNDIKRNINEVEEESPAHKHISNVFNLGNYGPTPKDIDYQSLIRRTHPPPLHAFIDIPQRRKPKTKDSEILRERRGREVLRAPNSFIRPGRLKADRNKLSAAQGPVLYRAKTNIVQPSYPLAKKKSPSIKKTTGEQKIREATENMKWRDGNYGKISICVYDLLRTHVPPQLLPVHGLPRRKICMGQTILN